MSTNKPVSVRILGTLLYLIGIAIGLSLLVFSAWGTIEVSTALDSATRGAERLSSLQCPTFIAKDETGVISITIKNTTERDVNPLVRANITYGSVAYTQEDSRRVQIAPGDSVTLEWEVTRKNAAYDKRLIFGKFYQFSSYSLPSRMGTCGILVLPFSGVSGQMVWIVSFVLSLALMTAGIALLLPKDRISFNRANDTGRRARTRLNSLIFLGVYALAASLLALLGDGLLSIALLVIATLSTVSIFSYSLTSR